MCPCNSEKGYVCTACRAVILKDSATMNRSALNRRYGHWKCAFVLDKKSPA